MKKLGGLHKFMVWDQANPYRFRWIPGVFPGRTCVRSKKKGYISSRILTDSKIFMGPEAEYADPVQSCVYDRNGV